MNTLRRLLLPVGSLLLLVFILTACTGPAERVWLNAPGWNRARLVGNTPIVDPASIALDDEGNIYLFMIGGDKDAPYPRVIALNREADVLWDNTYEVALKWPDQPRILWDGERLQLFWLSERGLYNAQVDATSAQLVGQPTLLSGESKTGSYDVTANVDGASVVWYAGLDEKAGLYALPPGDLTGEAILVDAQGDRPDLQYDDAGTLHVAWFRYPPGYDHPQFLYAAYQDGVYAPGQETIVLEPPLGTTTVFGPWLGIDEQRAYLFWNVFFRIGPRAGDALTYYVHFPHGQPTSASSVRNLIVPASYELPYQNPPDDGLEAGPRVPLGGGPYAGADRIAQVSVNSAAQQELVIAFRGQLEYLRRKEQNQVSTVFFQDGTPAAYQQVSFTPASSGHPAILSDAAGQLYITWLEDGALSGYDVYFASTAPDIQAALSGLTWGEVGPLVAETLFGLLTGAVLVPLALLWTLPALVILGLTSVIRRDEESFTSPGVIVSLGLAITAYWVTKLTFMPTVRDYVPFSAWLPFLPPALNFPLQVGVPLLITGLALAVAWRYTYGGERPSSFFFLLIYAVVDGALTMAIYGVTFYAAF